MDESIHNIELTDKPSNCISIVTVKNFKQTLYSGGQAIDTYIAVDIETTGFSSINDDIIEIGAVQVCNGEITDKFQTFINPDKRIPYHIVRLTGISSKMVAAAPNIADAIKDFCSFIGDAPLIAHNASFDMRFLKAAADKAEISFNPVCLDTLALSRHFLPGYQSYGLENLCKELNIVRECSHRGIDDAIACSTLFKIIVDKATGCNRK